MHSLKPDEERRGSRRRHLYHRAASIMSQLVKMQFGADTSLRECLILDISDEGVRLSVVGFDVPDEFVLLFAGDDVVRERYKVIWRRDGEVGARFVGRVLPQSSMAS